MAFSKKMMEFPSDFVSFSTKLPSEVGHEKIALTFFTGFFQNDDDLGYAKGEAVCVIKLFQIFQI